MRSPEVQPIYTRNFAEKEIDPVCITNSVEARELKVEGALEALQHRGIDSEETKEVVRTIRGAVEALKSDPSQIAEAVDALKKLPDSLQVEWYRTLGPIARHATLQSVAAGEPDVLRQFISSGFAVLNFPSRDEVREAAITGFEKLAQQERLDAHRPLSEVGEKLAKLGALADLSPSEVWERVAHHLPELKRSKDGLSFILLTYPVATASLEEIVKLPQKFQIPILGAQRASHSEIPSQIMRGTKVLPCDACDMSRISRELYGHYFGTEVVVEQGRLGNQVGFQRAWWGAQEIGYYKTYLEKGQRESILGTTRHEIDHLETTLLARMRPEEAFATSCVCMNRENKEDQRRLFPYGRFCRVDELRSYLFDSVHVPDERESSSLQGKLIHEVLDVVVPHEADPQFCKFYTDDDAYPGQVVGRYSNWSDPASANYALHIPLPESRGVESPENQVLFERALISLREYVTSAGRYHRGEGDIAVQREKERVLGLIERKERFSISWDYWFHFHNEPSVISGVVNAHIHPWAKNLASGDEGQITPVVRSIANAFTPSGDVRKIRDEAIERMAKRPHLIKRVLDAVEELPGGDWPASARARGAVVDAALEAVRKGDLTTFFTLSESPILFRSSRLTDEKFILSGQEASGRLDKKTSWAKSYIDAFRIAGPHGVKDKVPALSFDVAPLLLELRSLLEERGDESPLAATKRILMEKGIGLREHHKDGLTVLPDEKTDLGRLAAACFVVGRGMRLDLKANSRPYYDYSKHTLSLGVFCSDDRDVVAGQISEAVDGAVEQLLFRADVEPSDYLFVIRRPNPETGKTERVYIEHNEVEELLRPGREWALDVLTQFLGLIEREGKLPVTANPDKDRGAWKVYGTFECPSGEVSISGTSGVDAVGEEGVSKDAFLPLARELQVVTH